MPCLLATTILLIGATTSLSEAQQSPRSLNPAGPLGFYPLMAASADMIYVVWDDVGPFSFYGGIYLSRSPDGGRTWLPNSRISARPRPGPFQVAPNQGYSCCAELAAVNDSVYIAYVADAGIFFGASVDSGDSWSWRQVFPGGNAAEVRMAVEGNSVYLVWSGEQGGGLGTLFDRSLNAGDTWLHRQIRIDVGVPPGPSTYESERPQIAAMGSDVYAVWTDGSDIYFNRSLDRGSTWLTAAVRLNTGTPPGVINMSVEPRMAVAGGCVYVAWYDQRNGGRDIYFNRSCDAGMTWLSVDAKRNGTLAAQTIGDSPLIAASGNCVYVAWGESRSGNYHVFIDASCDNGQTWLPTEQQLGTSFNYDAAIAASISDVVVAWSENSRIGVNRSVDQGTTWLPMDATLPPGHVSDALLFGSSAAVVSWTNSLDVIYDMPFGYQTYGSGTAGTGGITPSLAGSGHCSIGQQASIDIGNARGSAPCVLAYSLNGSAAIPIGPGVLYVAPPLSYVTVSLGGSLGVAGAGTGQFSFTLPNSLALLGLQLNFQAGIADPAATAGTALTSGLEMWIW